MTLWQIAARFLSVGLICALLHNAIVITASFWHIHYAIACVISYVVVVVLGFALHTRFTFKQPPTLAAFWRYSLGMAANYPLTLALLFVLCDLAGLAIVIASPVATVLLVVWNYLTSRWAIARKPQAAPLASRTP